MHTTPASLLERVRQPGQARACERFVELYMPLLYHWARGVGMQDQDAADLVQDVLTSLVHKLPQLTYDPGKSFRGWLRTVTLNRWRDLCKHRSRRPEVGDGAALAEAPAPEENGTFWEAEYNRRLVDRALEI